MERAGVASRERAMLTAFAIHAAELERTTVDIVEALGQALSQGGDE